MEKKKNSESILHFIGVGIVVTIFESFPEASFWLPLGLIIIFTPFILFEYKNKINILYTLILTLFIIGIELIINNHPELLYIPDTIGSESELYVTIIIFSILIYFFISLIFHFFIKSHWINIITTTYIILLYKIIYNFNEFIKLKHTFISFIAMLIGLLVGVTLSLYLGYIAGNFIRKKIDKNT